MCSRLLCLLVPVNLNGGGTLKIMFLMLIHQAGHLVVCFGNEKLHQCLVWLLGWRYICMDMLTLEKKKDFGEKKFTEVKVYAAIHKP